MSNLSGKINKRGGLNKVRGEGGAQKKIEKLIRVPPPHPHSIKHPRVYERNFKHKHVIKVYVNFKTSFIEQQCYMFMSLAQGSCALATSLREDRSNNMSTL